MLGEIRALASGGASGRRHSTPKFTRRCLVALTGGIWLCAPPAWSASADLGRAVAFNIPSQPLETALLAFSRQAHIQVVIAPNAARDVTAPALTGTLPASTALTELLDASGLRYEAVGDTVTVVRGSPTPAAPPLPDSASDQVRIASSGGGARSTAPAPANDAEDVGSSTQHPGAPTAEVLVTAQKRSERIQDVPVPVTVLDTSALLERDQTRLQDYFATVPGLSLNTSQGLGGQQTIVIRGISTGSGNNPTVGVAIDGVPYGSSSFFGDGGLLVPDIDPGDLERIEVLRGPQGTLYGANSMGGLVNFITVDPSTTGLSGRVQVLGSDVEHGEFGYGARGAVNIPLSDTFAIRASGFSRRDPGYVENVTTGQTDVNQADVYGGHLSALWRPSDSISLKLGALIQHTNGDGSPGVDTNALLQPTIGYPKQARLPGTGDYSVNASLYTATLTAKLAGMDFTSISGYGINRWSELQDVTGSVGSYAEQLFNVAGASEPNHFETKKFTQEIRLSSATGQTLEWLVGGFYTHESTPAQQFYLANDAASGSSAGEMVEFNEASALSEYAVFGDLTVHFTKQFDVQFGGRESWNRQTFNETDSGPLVPIFGEGTSPYVQPTEHTNENAFTYLLTPRFRITRDFMVYARFASGYRAGGPNLEAALYDVPVKYAPDKTNNYEVGIKGDLLDHTLTFDASAYYIDWKNVQIYLLNPLTFAAYFANAGNAKSQGLELSVQARPITGLTLSAVASVDEAVLTQDLPSSTAALGFAGDRLPFSSRFSGSLSADDDIVHVGRAVGFIGGSVSYVGAREGEFVSTFTPTQPRLRFPAYATVDLRTGMRYDAWTVDLFLKNLSDKRGIVGGGNTYAGSGYDAVYIQPRTVGLSLTRTF